MELKGEVHEGFEKARFFVFEGVEQILSGSLDEAHGISSSPGATALAALALLAVGRGFEDAQQRGIQWLRQQYKGGWGKFPGDTPDEEITQIVRMVLRGSQGGWKAKLRLLSQARQFSYMILSLGQRVVPGLEGPTPEEILLPTILEDRILTKLPHYGRPVVVAASILASNSLDGIQRGIQYLLKTQMADGSWAEDIIATSLATLAIISKGSNLVQTQRAAQWLVQKQYPSGGWPAFDQLGNWAMGWALSIFGETTQRPSEIPWLNPALNWLKKAQNADGSYGSTPPYTHPDLDDTAVALIGLHQVLGEQNQLGVNLLKRLQNFDGSWGTFPSFQGVPPNVSTEFPVYISSVDVSIHVLEALWRRSRSQDEQIWRGINWILAQQDDQGAFPASWFTGSIYSTAQALELLSKWKFSWERWNTARNISVAKKKGQIFLVNAQNHDGGWGSAVETSLSITGLWRYSKMVPREVFNKGIRSLLAVQKSDGSFEPSYRGVYAKGWNYEEPITTALTAIRALQRYQRLDKGKGLFFKKF
ncbi:prenyltransferase/squalene oxidase repeat-containing protein [Desulfosporosinus sp. Sb-LF]|uniref:prenyltransferase/squalene oxidase repeat-containing protein n=1 Tax=Desulfosporosinus sp. Sb-LF TaxID=2560027 RepID=UPI00107F0AE8|nr:prenyltransferase/squalene oxidase repeat-containing protein [Desulfosporosinus sp. Sb-LF]TGE32279.1 prenyltransferase [Desulfosporosinus sp. Sb-LF]